MAARGEDFLCPLPSGFLLKKVFHPPMPASIDTGETKQSIPAELLASSDSGTPARELPMTETNSFTICKILV